MCQLLLQLLQPNLPDCQELGVRVAPGAGTAISSQRTPSSCLGVGGRDQNLLGRRIKRHKMPGNPPGSLREMRNEV